MIRRALALLALLLSACHSELRTDSQVQQVTTVDARQAVQAQADEKTVVRRTEAPDHETITEDTYYPPLPAPPDGAPELVPTSQPPGQTMPAPARGPLKSHKVIVRDNGAVTTEVAHEDHAAVATQIEQHAATSTVAVQHEERTTDVGLSWPVKVALLATVVLATALAWRFRRFFTA